MRILYCAMRWDYGDPDRGLSFEETNFRSALEGMGHEVIAFDCVDRAKRGGKASMRTELVSTAAATRPEVALFCLFSDELDPRTIERVGAEGGCPTVNWFADDHWRFESFTRHFAPAFDLAVTTDEDALPKYAAEGLRDRVLLSQWACNRYAYSKVVDAVEHDVTFVGQAHGNRPETIAALADAGVPVQCWGLGWPSGRLDHDAMVRVFSTSRINLNLSNSSTDPRTLRARVGALLGRAPEPMGWRERIAVALDRAPAGRPRPSQIKGRTFEIPGCGGFQLTEHVPHLERYFAIGTEVAVYASEGDLVEQARHWIEHDGERRAIAEAGHRRVLAEHTYDHRFGAIFDALDRRDRAGAGQRAVIEP